MTFDQKDLVTITQPKWTHFTNANRVIYLVTRAGRVVLSSSFSLPNTLLVPLLSKKLLYVGQATQELNYCVLMYHTFYLFQDILTKEIISRGIRKGGCTTYMTLALAKQTMCTNRVPTINTLYCGTNDWDILQ